MSCCQSDGAHNMHTTKKRAAIHRPLADKHGPCTVLHSLTERGDVVWRGRSTHGPNSGRLEQLSVQHPTSANIGHDSPKQTNE